jgi:hypothetical protein
MGEYLTEREEQLEKQLEKMTETVKEVSKLLVEVYARLLTRKIVTIKQCMHPTITEDIGLKAGETCEAWIDIIPEGVILPCDIVGKDFTKGEENGCN